MPVSTDDRVAEQPGDLALVAATFGVALRAAGVPADPGRCERFARAVTVARPATLPGLYLCALATLVASQDHIETLKRVFRDMFGRPEDLAPADGEPQSGLPGGHPRTSQVADILRDAAKAARAHASQAGPAQPERPGPGWWGPEPAADGDEDQPQSPASRKHLVPLDEPAPEDEDAQGARHTLASAAERLASTDFAELTPAELLLLSGLDAQAHPRSTPAPVAPPAAHAPRAADRPAYHAAPGPAHRRSSAAAGPAGAAARTAPAGPRGALRHLRFDGALRAGHAPVAVLRGGRCGRRGVHVRDPADPADRHAGAHPPRSGAPGGGPDGTGLAGGTRIGESLAEFNDSYGRRGMARGAVVVIISDGWDTGDPAILRREMERLSRVAHRIVWVNPRTQSPEYQPLAGGMAAAWPYCDAVVSAHSLTALDDLTAALAHPGRYR